MSTEDNKDLTAVSTENTVEANPTESKPVAIDQKLVDDITKELDALNADMKNKVYPIKLEDEISLIALIDFIDNGATWKNMEALGIIEVSKALHVEKAKGLKSGNIFLQSLPIQALSFFLSKVEDKGLQRAERHIKFVKPLDEALKLIKQDTDKVNSLESKLAAAENGIEIEKTPEK